MLIGFISLINMDRETGSHSKQDTFHLKQTEQNIMHRFLELCQDFV